MLEIVLSKLSRHDTRKPLSGFAGDRFMKALKPFTPKVHVLGRGQPRPQFQPDTTAVLLLGEEALRLFKEGVSLNEQRGSPFTIGGKLFLATYEPQEAFDRRDVTGRPEIKVDKETEKTHQKTQRENWRFWLFQDLEKLKRLATKGIEEYPSYTTITAPNPEKVIKDLEHHATNKCLTFDIETRLDLAMTCFGYAIHGHGEIPQEVVVVPYIDLKGELFYGPRNTARILRALSLAMTRSTVIGHNISGFDLYVLASVYNVMLPSHPYDTMIAHHRIYPEVEKSLGHCISLYTDLPYHKSEGIFEPKSNQQQRQLWDYNAKDVFATALVYNKLTQQSRYDPGLERSIEHGNRMVRASLITTIQGIRVNEEALDSTQESFAKRAKQLERVLATITEQPLNPRSPKQVKDYYYSDLGFKEPHKDPTNETQLLTLLNKYQIPSVKVIIEARRQSKLASYLKFNLTEQRRATTSYGLGMTKTFRNKAAKVLGEYGLNLQNVSDKVRHIFVPDKGKIFIQIDQAGAEAKIVAYLCRDSRFRALFKNGIKPHVYVCIYLFKQYFDEVLDCDTSPTLPPNSIEDAVKWKYWKDLAKAAKESGLKYDTGKMVVHAGNYGMKAPTFQKQALKKSDNQLILTKQQSENYLKLYHELFIEISEWWGETVSRVKHTGILRNLFGFPRSFTGLWSDELWKEAYAHVPQSTVSENTNMAHYEIQHELIEKGYDNADILQNGHDSLLMQVPEDQANEVAEKTRKYLERSFEGNGESFTMGTEVLAGYNWGKKSKDNPNGMEDL